MHRHGLPCQSPVVARMRRRPRDHVHASVEQCACGGARWLRGQGVVMGSHHVLLIGWPSSKRMQITCYLLDEIPSEMSDVCTPCIKTPARCYICESWVQHEITLLHPRRCFAGDKAYAAWWNAGYTFAS
jgi:hypothetical protein